MHMVNRELKHVTHKLSKGHTKDVLFIKERLIDENGVNTPNLRIVENYKRPFWITKSIYRNHKQVKEAEYFDRLTRFESTESDLAHNIFKALKSPKFGRVSMRDVKTNRDHMYVYGADIDHTTLLTLEYRGKNEKITPSIIGFLDIENHPYRKIISVITFAVRYGDDVISHTWINKEEADLVTPEIVIPQLLKKHLPDKLPKEFDFDKIQFNINSFNNEKDLLVAMFKTLHETDMDILSGWNFLYDIKEIRNACERNGLNPHKMFSHPSIPDEHCFLRIQEAPMTKTKENGDVVSVPIEERWNKFYCPAMFKIIDAMSGYKYIRLQQPKLKGGYSLDNVMRDIGLFGKLNIVELPIMSKVDWHIVMLEQHTMAYMAYNVWDTLGLIYKDMIDKDLQIKLPLLSNISSFDKFNSVPNRTFDDFYKFYLDEGMVLANKLVLKPELKSLGRDDWTVTVNLWKLDKTSFEPMITTPYLLPIPDEANIRLNRLISAGYLPEQYMNMGRVTTDCFELDLSAAYPSVASYINASADTVKREIFEIGNIDKEVFRECNINLVTGVVADQRYCELMFNMPTLRELELAVEKEIV